jgi:hypothetical protein
MIVPADGDEPPVGDEVGEFGRVGDDRDVVPVEKELLDTLGPLKYFLTFTTIVLATSAIISRLSTL